MYEYADSDKPKLSDNEYGFKFSVKFDSRDSSNPIVEHCLDTNEGKLGNPV